MVDIRDFAKLQKPLHFGKDGKLVFLDLLKDYAGENLSVSKLRLQLNKIEGITADSLLAFIIRPCGASGSPETSGAVTLSSSAAYMFEMAML